MYRVDFFDGIFEAEEIERSQEKICALATYLLFTEWKVSDSYTIKRASDNPDSYEPPKKIIEGLIEPVYADGVVYRESAPHYVVDITVINTVKDVVGLDVFSVPSPSLYTVGLIEKGYDIVLGCICKSYLDILQDDYIRTCQEDSYLEDDQGVNRTLYDRESHFLIKRY